MPLIYEIAEHLGIPNEYVFIDSVVGNLAWFHLASGARYTCRVFGDGKHLKKNSIRAD